MPWEERIIPTSEVGTGGERVVFCLKEDVLARNNYSYQKRQRELAKKKKKEEKRQNKLARKNARAEADI